MIKSYAYNKKAQPYPYMNFLEEKNTLVLQKVWVYTKSQKETMKNCINF